MKSYSNVAEVDSSASLQQAALLLKGQVDGAIQAISDNDLEHLEECLWQQQVLCAQIQSVAARFQLRNLSDQSRAELAHAAAQILSLNRTYAELIEHARRTNDILYQLCLEYAEAVAHPFPTAHRPFLGA